MPAKKKHPSLDRKKGLYLQFVTGKGRGVFCRSAVRRGEALEVTPAIILSETETSRIDRTMLQQYTFVVGKVSKWLRKMAGMKSVADSSAVIMGMMTFCNHGSKPNAEIVWEEIDGTVYYTLQATRAIPKNTEICTSYGSGWFNDRTGKIKKTG